MTHRTAVVFLIAVWIAGPILASEIREFDVRTLERLGNELSHRDGIAARATDFVLKEYPLARSLKMRGWITELRKDGGFVYFVLETPAGPSLAYIVTFQEGSKPKGQDVRGQPLPPNIAVRYKARETARAALRGRLFDLNYNLEILNDPDGDGFLVYALGATAKPGEVVLAGHLRVSVSPDGTKAKRIDALSQTMFVSSKKNSGLPKGYHSVALYFNQIVSNKPVETFIYTSNLAQKNIYVSTPDGNLWVVEKGRMRIDHSKPSSKTEAGAARQAMGH